MSQSDGPLLANLTRELRHLTGELREMLHLRWRLFRLEAVADLKNARRLIAVTAVAGVMALSSLPLVAAALADLLAGVWHIARWGWLLIFAGSLLLGAVLAAYLAWRRFRRRFVGLQETLEELREDRVWIEEWISRKDED